MENLFAAASKVCDSLNSSGWEVELNQPNLPVFAPDDEAKRLKKKAREENPEFEWRGDPWILLKDHLAIADVCQHLRDELGWEQIIDVTAMDFDAEDSDLCGVYQFLSLSLKARLTIEVRIPKDACQIPSVAKIYPGADWHEREAMEMFGITYEGHPDPRNILLPDAWEGFPLRKDYQFPDEYNGVSCK